MSSDSASSSNNTVGQVKWFNNKAGYGFITIKDADGSAKDIFCHYTNLKVDESQYKYLVQGEYVEFVLAPLDDGKHEVQATQITGINGGQLMCQTRKLNAPTTERVQRTPRARPSQDGDRPPRKSAPRKSAPVKKDESVDEEGFKTVTKKTRRA